MIRLWRDERIGGTTRYVLAEEPPMFIPDEVRKCVFFILCRWKEDDSERFMGTGFVLGVRSGPPGGGRGFLYLVTAQHVLGRILEVSADGQALLRFNSREGGEGGVLMAEMSAEGWLQHPDDSAFHDVAVMPVGLDREVVDFAAYPTSGVATPEVIAEDGIGIGHEVFVTGLFVNHAGTERNIPIVRIGNIAAMPEEKVVTRDGAMEAYLVEARSIGGLSGSPVFVNLEDPLRSLRGRYMSTFYLLGLMHGHYDVRPAKSTLLTDEAINMGIGIVAPASHFMEIIDGEVLMARRKKAEEEHAAKNLPTMDTAVDDEYERFEDLTKRLVEVPKREIDEKRKESGES